MISMFHRLKNHLKSFWKRKIGKWTVILGTLALSTLLILATISSIGGSIVTFLLSFQQEICNQQKDNSSGNISVSGYSKSAMSKAVAIAEAVGADLNIKPALIFAQLAAETGIKDTTEVRDDNNFGGIKYSPSFSNIATPGNVSTEGDHYAHFKNISGFATIYRNTIKQNLGEQKPRTWSEFVKIMKAHGYFGADVNEYIHNGQGWYDNYAAFAKKYGKGKIKVSSSSNGNSDDASDLSNNCPDTDDGLYTGSWTWPFKSISRTPDKIEGGQFGITAFPRGSTNFHDGFDFSNGLNGVHNGASVVAVTSGKIYKVGYNSSASYYVWEKAGNYNIIYQEGFGSHGIAVHKGESVKIGQKIGTLGGNHLHLGITTNDKNPDMNKTGSPVANGFDHPSCWLNPITVILKGLKK